MGPVAQAAAKPPPLAGRKYLDVLGEHVAYLRDLPAHGNRTLHLHPLVQFVLQPLPPLAAHAGGPPRPTHGPVTGPYAGTLLGD